MPISTPLSFAPVAGTRTRTSDEIVERFAREVMPRGALWGRGALPVTPADGG